MFDVFKSQKYIRLEAYGMGPYAMKKMKVCKQCGQITDVRKFICPMCRKILSGGTLFDIYKKMHVHCPYCRTILTADTRYCPNCGRKVPSKSMKLDLKKGECFRNEKE